MDPQEEERPTAPLFLSLGIALQQGLVGREQRVLEHVVSHLLADYLAVVARKTEVDARVNARVLHFVQRLREAMVRASDSDQQIIVDREMRLFSKEGDQHCRSRAAHRRVTGRILRMRRCSEERHPRRVPRIHGYPRIADGRF